jgi:CRP/FNR family transcriptional regulator, anaerobic regulatory protein
VRTRAVCAALSDAEVGALENIMTSASVEANQILVDEGEPRRRVYTLTGGMLRLSIALPDGRRQITGFLMPGDYLGLADEGEYSQTAEAVVASKLCAFPVREMEGLQDQFPRLKDRLHQMTRLALRRARDSQMVLGRLTPVEKLASFLLMFSARAAENKLPDNPLLLPMSRTDIADYLGLTIETVSRSFTKLKTQGVIRLPEPQIVEIVDRTALEDISGIVLHA